MRRLFIAPALTPANWPRIAVGLAVPGLVVAATLAAPSPASAATYSAGAAHRAGATTSTRTVRGEAAPACTDTWVGAGSEPDWTIGKNWSTGKVPGATSNVCITSTGVDVLTDVSININSLQLGEEEGIAMEGTAADPLTATIAGSVTLTPGLISRIDLTDATVKATDINDEGGTIFTDGDCALDASDVFFGDGGSLQAANGTTTLTSLPQLANGALRGATFFIDDATLVLPSDVTHLVDSSVLIGPDSAIDASGEDALTGLTSIDAKSSLTEDSDLTLDGSLVADGNVSLGSTVTVPGTYTQAAGTLALDQGTTLSAGQTLIDPGATLGDDGTIGGNLTNDGTAQIGAEGTTRVTGDYTQGADATLQSGLSGPLAVGGTATLAGTDSIVTEEPTPGSRGAIITFGSLSGGFTSTSLGFRLVTKSDEIVAITTPQIAASPTTVAPNGSATVSGGSFEIGDTVDIFFNKVSGTPLATPEAEYPGGVFSVPVTIPAKAKAGTNRIIAVSTSGNRAVTTITVS
jgi:hypothetical protein